MFTGAYDTGGGASFSAKARKKKKTTYKRFAVFLSFLPILNILKNTKNICYTFIAYFKMEFISFLPQYLKAIKHITIFAEEQ